MLETDVIQYRGFHNLIQDGKVTGFQFCIRSDYYRGVWLSQLRPGKVVVDGVVYPKEQVIWEINGKDFTAQQMAEAGDEFWNISDTAVIKIMKEGGLEQGFHDLAIRFAASCSYMPPFMDLFDENGDDRSFNGGTYERKNMIIV